MTRKKMLTLQIKRWGNSAAIRIPNSVLLQLGWKEDDEIQLEVTEGKLVISKPSVKVSLNPHDVQILTDAGVDVPSLVNDFVTEEAEKIEKATNNVEVKR